MNTSTRPAPPHLFIMVSAYCDTTQPSRTKPLAQRVRRVSTACLCVSKSVAQIAAEVYKFVTSCHRSVTARASLSDVTR